MASRSDAEDLRTLHILRSTPSPENVRVSCGLPSKKAFSKTGRRIGECWTDTASKDGTFEIFISPTQADSYVVLATLVHELVHAVVGIAAGHKAPFRKCALAVGLEGKMTATHAGDDLLAAIALWIDELGKYPHAELAPAMTTTQRTRYIKAECDLCGMVIRVTAKWIEYPGLPRCACSGNFEVA